MLNVFGPVNILGTGVHTYQMAKAYESAGHEVCLIPPFGDVRFTNAAVQRWLANRLRFSPKDPSLMIFDPAFLAQFSGCPRLGMAVFETTEVSPLVKAMITSCDVVLTPTKWGRNILASQGIMARVVPEGYDPEEFCELAVPERKVGVFTFIHVGKCEERKGTAQTIRCFARALEGCEARLAMHINNPFRTEYEEVSSCLGDLGFASPDGIHFRRLGLQIVFTNATDESIARLYRAADCGIFPSRGEGWGLPILECVATGVPAITGRWTGMTEYLQKEYPQNLLIRNPRIETARDGRWFDGRQGSWFVTEDEELIERIRFVFDKGHAMRASEEWKNAVRYARRFTWANAARELEAVLTDCGAKNG